MNRVLIAVLSVLLIGCGSGGGSSASSKITDYFPYMWNINPNSGYYQNGRAIQGADINLIDAWTQAKGEGVKVAVIDECFDTNHVDLKDNILLTYNIENNSSNISGVDCHGTRVAGVISAIENDIGVIGIAPKSKLILISLSSNASDADTVRAFEYAKDHNATVINCSWGSQHISQVVSDELNITKNAGIITIFASGNDDINLDDANITDESESPYVIGVGATSELNDVTDYSNYGSNIDLLAPGGSRDLGLSLLMDNNKYEQNAGTSFSAPTVAGAVALLLEKKPNLTFEQVRDSLIDTAQKVGGANANYINGFDTYRAYGKIDVNEALTEALTK